MKSLAALPGLELARRTRVLSLLKSTVIVTCPELRQGTQYLSVGFEYGFHTLELASSLIELPAPTDPITFSVQIY